ncbi:hypothetical protein [Clostridium chromiireducens]|uniref:Choloylglycine hydrolase n=1 Tax=Clostridium chromiireducens TaxID=225345 RepID=A0A1V4I890_9CLOT|nr:hypothetical protein [Clostridium chromiireducens]OPJ56100.1 hypothetical protein CLCHR_46000 [Clostridium chromiireducens]
MCTSFIHRREDILIAMNFDNNGMNYQIDTKDSNKFVVLVDGGRGKVPSFGINKDGMFINHLMVDSNGKGLYKRPSKKVTSTAKLVKDVLNGEINSELIDSYFKGMEIVNVPDYSIHNMISDKHGNVWVAEPGRGTIHSPAKETHYFIMTNFSLCDFKETGILAGTGTERYKIAEEMLSKEECLEVKGAFRILESVIQKDGEWKTAISMVYSQKEQAVYYCLDGDFKNIHQYSFES